MHERDAATRVNDGRAQTRDRSKVLAAQVKGWRDRSYSDRGGKGAICGWSLFADGVRCADRGNFSDQVPRFLFRDEACLLRQEHNAFID